MVLPVQIQTASPFLLWATSASPTQAKGAEDTWSTDMLPVTGAVGWRVPTRTTSFLFKYFYSIGGLGVGAEWSQFIGDRSEQLGPAACGPFVVPALPWSLCWWLNGKRSVQWPCLLYLDSEPCWILSPCLSHDQRKGSQMLNKDIKWGVSGGF